MANHSARCFRRWITASLGVCLVVFAFASLQGASFTASLDRPSVSAGESVTLTLQFEGGQPKQVPSPPAMPHLQIAEGGSGQSFQIINGKISASISKTFTLTPTTPGEYNIPALSAEINGQAVQSAPLKLVALKPGDAGPALAFLKIVVPKKEVYLGEILTLELQVFIKDGVANMEEILGYFDAFTGSPIKAEGFNVVKTGHTQRRHAQLNGANYSVATLVTALSPVKVGELTIHSIDVTVPLHLPVSGRSRRDPFDAFGFFGPQLEERRVALVAEPQTVTSLNLPPQGATRDFKGAVGTYTMSVTAAPTNVAVGEPVTLRVQISGHGNFDSLSPPLITETQNFKTYPPTSKIETTDPLGVQGAKTFEAVLVPQNIGATSSPPVSFTYFDPNQKTYATVRRDGIPLIIRPVGAEPQYTSLTSSGTQSNGPPVVRDIVPNKESLGKIRLEKPPLLQRPWFIGIESVPVLAWAGLLVWRRRTDALLNNPRLQRRRQVEKVVTEGMLQLDALAGQNESIGFFALLFRLIQELLGERLDLPAGAITEDVLKDRSAIEGLPDGTVKLLHELFETCDIERYAPASSSHQLAVLSAKFKQVANDMRKAAP